MIDICCRTNLDLCATEQWPSKLPSIPRIGDLIESNYEWNYKNSLVRLELEAVRITWKIHKKYEEQIKISQVKNAGYSDAAKIYNQVAIKYFGKETYLYELSPMKEIEYYPEVELHLPKNRFLNLIDFYDWYGRVCGRGSGAFI